MNMPNQPLRHCPDVYYENCLNAAIRCSRCAAGRGRPGSRLWYVPREAHLVPHPYHKDAQKSAQVKQARRAEAQARQQLIRATCNSGARYGDGDYKLTSWLHCDHKHRQKPCKRFVLTWEEYEKGLAQGVESWVITIHPEEGKTVRCVFLTERAFARLLAEAGVRMVKEGEHV